MLADRRLSSNSRPPKDDGRKVMFLETTDGVAILGYAGLGATARGTEPADWMGAVLRGRNLPLEQSLGVLADAMQRQFPRHMVRMAGRGGVAHNVIVPAFLGKEPRLYSIDLVFAADRKSYKFRYTRHVNPGGSSTPQLGIGGSGALHLMRNNKWMRNLLRVVRSNERGNASTNAVADYLATLNNGVAMVDKSVGPRCIVAWRFRKGGFHKGGGGQHFYTGVKRDLSGSSLPTIANGMDVSAIAGMMVSRIMNAVSAGKFDLALDLDKDEINAELARLPHKPDETLR